MKQVKSEKNTKKRLRRISAFLLAFCISVGSLSFQPHADAAYDYPDSPTPFVMKEELFNNYSTNDDDKALRVLWGKDYLGNEQSWWIAGKEPTNPDNLVLFAADSLLEPMKFHEKEDGTDWQYHEFATSDYNGKEVYTQNYYLTSDLRKALQDASKNEQYFTSGQQERMVPSTIRTLDRAALFKYEYGDMYDLDAWEEFGTGDDSKFEWNKEHRPNGYPQFTGGNLEYSENPDLYDITEDVLYAPYGEHETDFPTVGSIGYTQNSSQDPSSYLPIEKKFLEGHTPEEMPNTPGGEKLLPFWLRSPSTYYDCADSAAGAEHHENFRESALFAGQVSHTFDNRFIGVLTAGDAGPSDNTKLNNSKFAVQPAFQLDSSDLLFASSAKDAASHAQNGGDLEQDKAVTLRFDANGSLGEATVIESADENNQTQQVEIKGAPKGSYLVIQRILDKEINSSYDLGAYAVPVEGDMTVDLSIIQINGEPIEFISDNGDLGLADYYAIWLEKSEDGVTYASLADYRITAQGEHIQVNTPQDLEWGDLGIPGPFSEIICTPEPGYRFPDNLTLPEEKYHVCAREENGSIVLYQKSGKYIPAARTVLLPAAVPEENSLTVSVEVQNGDPNQKFDFKVEFPDLTDFSGTIGEMNFQNGISEFSLKSGERKSTGDLSKKEMTIGFSDELTVGASGDSLSQELTIDESEDLTIGASQNIPSLFADDSISYTVTQLPVESYTTTAKENNTPTDDEKTDAPGYQVVGDILNKGSSHVHFINAGQATSEYTITANAGEGGSISPDGAVTVAAGADQSFTMTANPGYHVKEVLVDGVHVGILNTYTFSDVQANHSISVQFEKDSDIPDPDPNPDPDPDPNPDPDPDPEPNPDADQNKPDPDAPDPDQNRPDPDAPDPDQNRPDPDDSKPDKPAENHSEQSIDTEQTTKENPPEQSVSSTVSAPSAAKPAETVKHNPETSDHNFVLPALALSVVCGAVIILTANAKHD